MTGELFLFSFFCIYLFLAALGLRCCAWAFSSCSELALLFIAVRGLLIAVASLVVEHGLQVCRLHSSCGWWALERRLGSCGAQAQLLCSIQGLPGPGLEPVSPALAGEFLTTTSPGKPRTFSFLINSLYIFLEQFQVYRKIQWKVQRVPHPQFPLLLKYCIIVEHLL